MLRVLLPALMLLTAATASSGTSITTTQVLETTSTTYVFTLPPEQQRCVDRLYEKTFHCQFHGCLKGCRGAANCRRLCARSRRRCLSANSCEVMAWPFCAGGVFPPCASASPSSPAWEICALLRLVNHSRDAIAAVAVNGTDLGITLPPGGRADAYVSPSRSGATIVAVGHAAGGKRCEWRVARKGCWEPGVQRRVVFRQSAAACAP